jgi:hypothetical protein
MKLKDADILELIDFFEDAISRAPKIDKQHKIHFRKKVRNELYFLQGWETASPAGVINRWEERLSEVLRVMPCGFRDELSRRLVDKLGSPLLKKKKLSPLTAGDQSAG